MPESAAATLEAPPASTPATPDVEAISPNGGDDLGLSDIQPETPAATDPPAPTPATPATPEKGPDAEPPVEPEAEPVVDPPAAPSAPPAAQAQPTAEQQQEQQRIALEQRQFAADMSEIQDKIAKGTYDPIDDGAKAIKAILGGFKAITDLQGTITQQVQAQQQTVATENFWGDYGRTNPDIGAETGRKVFAEEVTRLSGKGFSGEALRGAATVAFENRIEHIKAAKKSPAAAPITTPSKTVNKGAARITPAGTSGTVPPPKAKTIDEKLEAGEYGNIADIA